MDCKHEHAKATGNLDEFWCPECGDTFNLNDASDHTGAVSAEEVTVAAKAASTKRSPNRKPRAKPTDRNPLPMGVLSEHVDRASAQRPQGVVLPSITPTRVAAPAKREAPADVPATETAGVIQIEASPAEIAQLRKAFEQSKAELIHKPLEAIPGNGEVQDFTSADADMPVGPWHGIPCPNRSKGCTGIMETYRVFQPEKTGNTYFMKCPNDKVHVVLSFASTDAKS